MKKYNIISAIASLALLWGASACQSPEELVITPGQESIHSISAKLLGDESFENNFVGEVDFENGEIRIVLPYNYPLSTDNQLSAEQLSKVHVVASIHNSVSFTPSLGIMDLNKEHNIVMHDQYGVDHKFKLYAVIRKSDKCDITKFNFYDADNKKFEGIPNTINNTVSVLSGDNLGMGSATVETSYHSTISPDPSEVRDYTDPVEFEVTAQNGIDKKTWIIQKGFPPKLKRGFREGSQKLLWVTKLSSLGYNGGQSGIDSQNGIAPSGEYVVINQIGEKTPIYLNRADGSIAGHVNFNDITPMGGNTGNQCITSDDAGHIIVCNTDKTGTSSNFKIWKLNDVNATPVEIISDAVYYNYRGHHISVVGDVEKDAIITCSKFGSDPNIPASFHRWEIKDGQVVSQTPTEIAPLGFTSVTYSNIDVMYLKPDVNSDYLVNAYATFNGGGSDRYITLHGANNAIKSLSPYFDPNGSTAGPNSENWVNAQVDYIEFNNIAYVADM
ncbi:MAG: DUF5018 domain-containing protein, partial [Muribaculaceae bacterium]|nr:DUF5018 domain-containing protein [Muribaculaceae bacterium]